jgi:23S rRNA pseudouridine1911/1915/1917 synthase
VVLLAKDREAARKLERQFHARRVHKEYVAVLRGSAPDAFVVDAPIARREPAEAPYFRVVDAGAGKPSLTRFERIARRGHGAQAISLVRAEPVSGRTNQIRVHAAHAGHPVLGDKIYGVPEDVARAFVRNGETPELLAAAGAARQLLHCARIALAHPSTGEPWEVAAAPPPDLLDLFPELADSPPDRGRRP